MKPYGNGMRNEPRSVGFILVLRAQAYTFWRNAGQGAPYNVTKKTKLRAQRVMPPVDRCFVSATDDTNSCEAELLVNISKYTSSINVTTQW